MSGRDFLIDETLAVTIVQPTTNPRITIDQIPGILEVIKKDYGNLDVAVPVFVHFGRRSWVVYGDTGPLEVNLDTGVILNYPNRGAIEQNEK